jgi:NAD-dependent DNA ligase
MTYDELPIEDKCMVHRYLYYVKNNPIISDQEYDQLERKAVETADENHPIHRCGSDMEKSYSDEIKLIANSL